MASSCSLVLLTYKPAEWLKNKIVKKEDSLNAQIIVDALCTVLMISVLLTVIGTCIGTRHISIEPIKNFFLYLAKKFYNSIRY